MPEDGHILLTVAIVTACALEHDIEGAVADVGEHVERLSLWDAGPEVDHGASCLCVDLKIRAENVVVEGWSEETSVASPPCTIGYQQSLPWGGEGEGGVNVDRSGDTEIRRLVSQNVTLCLKQFSLTSPVICQDMLRSC